MIRLNRTTVALLATLFFAAPAAANDAVAPMGAGGLVFQRADGIEMRSEDLYVSAREVRARYRFFNQTDRNLATLVSFPMPDLTGGIEGAVALESPQLMQFTTVVNGRRVATNVEQKAVLNGVDHTGLLRGLGLPLSPRGDATVQAIAILPGPQINMLVEMGLIEDRSWTDGGIRHAAYVARWTMKTTHYWTQVFPARRKLDILHSYTPAVGGSSGSVFGDPAIDSSEEAARFCTNDAFQAGARRMRSRGLHVSETWLDYILTPGSSWPGTIGDFRLVVDKGSSRNLMSFCGEGLRRAGSTRIEIRRRNFTPSRDLSVLILTGERVRN